MSSTEGKTAALQDVAVTFRQSENARGFEDVLDALAGILIDNAERDETSSNNNRRRSNAA